MECIIQTVMFRPFTGHDVVVSIVIAVLLGCSALVSGSETAFFSLTPRNIAQLKTGRSRSGRAILKLLSVQEYLLATILIVNNLVNICIVILSNGLIDSLTDFGGAAGLEFVVKTVVVTFLLLLFGEIMPKIFASYNPLRVARMTSIPLLLLKSVFRPLAYVLIRSGSYINESVAKKRVNISIDELSNAIEMTTDQTVEERRMLSGIVGFVHTEVVEIMKPRVDIVALDLKDDFAEVRRVIIESGFSRIPVCEEGIDDVKGVLYVKDMLPYISHGDDFEWQHLIRRAYFVPEHKKINDLLEEFQNNKIHMAIVVDEYGSTLGLVSLEDILEEIVGEISDESDIEQSFYTKLSENTYLFDGKTHLNDFLKVLSFDEDYLDEAKGEAETLAGLMLEIRKVCEEGIDDVKGVLYVKDMLPYISHGDDFEWQHLIRRAYFVPEHKKINDLLEEFQNNKIHMAIVVDEYGSTLGLVSLEDILEEIVGEISDESDIEQSFYTKLSENTYLFDGKTHLNDFLKVLSFDEDYLDEAKGEAETLAGLMLEIRKDFLRRGETLAYRRLTLRVDAMDGRRIDKIRVTVADSED